ncbi:hypothetical protein GD606_00430 [Desulfolutivibrio sulfodismutans DSM 3696]|nr:hypothetical protein GD606_00430 [Desulfolutivibrio sulfodismutans DSM 3696]
MAAPALSAIAPPKDTEATRMRTSILTMFFLALGVLAALPGAPCRAASQAAPIERVVIADTQGDWGAPSPYLHDKRGPGYVLTTLVFDTLIWKNGQGGLIPSLAASWRAEGESYAFELDPAAKWHDGAPVTPEDVVFTFDYVKKHPYFNVDVSMVAAVEKTGPHSVTCTLSRPFVPFLTNVAGSLPILPRHIFEAVDDPGRFTAPKALTGSGPYRLAAYDQAQGQYLFAANPEYHLGAPLAGEIVFMRMSPPAALAALKTGQVDLATSVPAASIDELTAAGITCITFQTSHPVRLKFNHKKPILAQAAVRQGLAHLVDRPRMVETVYLGRADLWDARGLAPLAPGAADLYPHDPAAAARLLSSAGWTRQGDAPWRTETGEAALTLVALKQYDALARMTAAQLTAGGVPVTVALHDRGGLNDRLTAGDYDLAVVSFSQLGDPDTLRHAVLGKRPESDDYAADPELTALLTAQVSETDPARRQAMVEAAGERFASELPSFCMLSAQAAAGSRDRIRFFVTPGGIGQGTPLILNKKAFLP